MSTKQTLELIFKDVFDDEDITINDETTADDIEDWDSLTHIQLIVEIEQKFQIKFTIEEIKNAKNVGEFIQIIDRKVG